MTEHLLHTDEREDIIASLMLVKSQLDHVDTDLAAWKWILVGTHSCLQSAMAFHLGFGNDLLVATQECAEKWLDAHAKGTPYPDLMMDGFLDLYDKIKKHEILGYKFSPQGSQGGSVKLVNRLRNQFVHFMPKGWTIELSGLPTACRDCLSIVSHLDGGSMSRRWESEAQQQRARTLLVDCMSKLDAMAAEYGA